MEARLAALVLTTLTACASCSRSFPDARADDGVTRAGAGAGAAGSGGGGVAVVELFTSEGCSSCPPADAVLAELAEGTDRRVFALAFHVDYWDELGWPDRFASPDSTARQREYARALGLRGVYTPQMIVGGTEQFTGSDRGRAGAAIARAIAKPASVALSLRPRWTGAGSLTVDYDARDAPAGSILDVAVVERAASTSVGAGENAGKTLHHANVVRAFVAKALDAPAGSVVVQLPPSPPLGAADAVAFVQRPSADGGGMPVLGATRARLP
jgi:hypothetical protein